jgi:hypothetical protein
MACRPALPALRRPESGGHGCKCGARGTGFRYSRRTKNAEGCHHQYVRSSSRVKSRGGKNPELNCGWVRHVRFHHQARPWPDGRRPTPRELEANPVCGRIDGRGWLGSFPVVLVDESAESIAAKNAVRGGGGAG